MIICNYVEINEKHPMRKVIPRINVSDRKKILKLMETELGVSSYYYSYSDCVMFYKKGVRPIRFNRDIVFDISVGKSTSTGKYLIERIISHFTKNSCRANDYVASLLYILKL